MTAQGALMSLGTSTDVKLNRGFECTSHVIPAHAGIQEELDGSPISVFPGTISAGMAGWKDWGRTMSEVLFLVM